MNYLVVGGDSTIGKNFHLENIQYSIATTRKKNERNKIFFDLEGGLLSSELLKKIDVAIICCGITSISECEKYSDKTSSLNVKKTIDLIKFLKNNNVFIVYLSSNAVFDGQKRVTNELFQTNPTCQYGLQKAAVENIIRSSNELRSSVAIIRLTKVLWRENTFISSGVETLRSGSKVIALSDLMISPISMPYALSGIKKIADKQRPGIFHLSNEVELSYFELLSKVSRRLKLNSQMVIANLVESNNQSIIFRPLLPSLGMMQTTADYDLRPETLEGVIKYLAGGSEN